MSWFRRGAPTADARPAPTGPGRPLQLVEARPDGTFAVGADAAAALKSIRGVVGVVAVAGRARQGKSYLLNKLVNAAAGGGGFAVSPSQRPCTKGILLWSAPIPLTDADGAPYHLVLLDTEGIDAFDQSNMYSTQLFALAVLLSSCLVYNHLGAIDEAAIDKLSLVTEVTKLVRARADEGGAAGGRGGGGGGGGPAALAPFAPTFLWLLRDFYLDLADDRGRAITPGDYLEAALAPVPPAAPGADGKNATRAAIKALFPRRDAAALVRPAADERDLQRLDALPVSALRPEFVAGLNDVTRRIFELATPKRIGGATLSGPVLAGLTRAYVDALNAGAVPTIATAWQGVAEQECRGAADEAESAYRAAFAAAGGDGAQDEAALDAAHAAGVEAGAAAYAARAVGDGAPRAAGDKKWRQTVAAGYAAHRAARLAAAELACQRLVGDAGVALADAIATPDATPATLAARLADMEKAYAAAAPASPAKWRLWASFVGGQGAAAARALAERAAAADRARADAAAAAATAAAARADAAERELAGARAAGAGAASAAAARVATLEAELAAARGARDDAAAAEAAAAAERAAAAAALARAEAAERDAAAARADAAAARAALADARAEVARLQAAAAAAPPPPPPADAAPPADEFMEASDEPAPDTMTVAAIKQWLTDAGHEAEVWRLAGARAKKADWVAVMQHVMRR